MKIVYVHAKSLITCIVIIELMIVFTINEIDVCVTHELGRILITEDISNIMGLFVFF